MKNIKLTKKETALMNELAFGEVRNYYTGTGRFSSKGADVATQAADVLKAFGMKSGIHFERGNDAPRGGWVGEYCRLTAKGRAWKVFSDLRRERREAEAAAERAKAECERQRQENAKKIKVYRLEKIAEFDALLESGETDEVKIMMSFFAAEFHPAPAKVLEIKRKNGSSWADLRGMYKGK